MSGPISEDDLCGLLFDPWNGTQAFYVCLIRLDAWFNGVPLAKTRISRFRRELQPLAV